MSLFKAALLAPVPEEHLLSGLETQHLEGKVAFGCDEPDIFETYQEQPTDGEIEVFICATPYEGIPENMACHVFWVQDSNRRSPS